VVLRMLFCQMLPLIFVVLRSVLAGFRSRREVALENLVLRHQLQVALRTNPTPRLRNPDRILWIWLRRLWPSWDAHLLVVKPERGEGGVPHTSASAILPLSSRSFPA
jgi:hypothetical protein